MDGRPRYGTGADHQDQFHHLAKVRVAGSNPVFRSMCARRGREEPGQQSGTKPPRTERPTGPDRRARPRGRRGTTPPRPGRRPPEKRGAGREGGGGRGFGGETETHNPCPIPALVPCNGTSGAVLTGVRAQDQRRLIL